jgi:hypothetical protein
MTITCNYEPKWVQTATLKKDDFFNYFNCKTMNYETVSKED